MIADTIIRGFALHSIYGCGIYLWGALWDALTHLLITISKKQQPSEVMGLRQKQIEPGPRPGESVIEMEPSSAYAEIVKRIEGAGGSSSTSSAK
ncbi:hypothetical protein M0802_015622 [Mischocyttarus mexicanus]|nr:hypothetical protein M0802_015622 [Mischocyttarus mexicanus]